MYYNVKKQSSPGNTVLNLSIQYNNTKSAMNTPEKLLEACNALSPPGKDVQSHTELSGYILTAHNHAIAFNNNIKDWSNLREKGIRLCKNIQSMRLFEITDKKYSEQVAEITESMHDIIVSMENIVEDMATITRQIDNLANLDKSNNTIKHTWCIKDLSISLDELTELFQRETAAKKIVAENIAHSKDEYIAEVYASTWQYNIHIQPKEIMIFVGEMELSNDDFVQPM